jgi:hypothetical protein
MGFTEQLISRPCAGDPVSTPSMAHSPGSTACDGPEEKVLPTINRMEARANEKEDPNH